MKIVCISDTHGCHGNNHLELPDGDILVHAGDLTGRGEIGYVESFVNWVSEYDYDEVIVIAGNHDFCFQNDLRTRALSILEEECIYLEDSSTFIDDLKIYGTPWSTKFGRWAFMGIDGNLKKVYEDIPEDVDILLSHGPPHKIMDKVRNSRQNESPHVGSKSLYDRIQDVDPRLVVFGHIHEAYGRKVIDGTTYINAALSRLRGHEINSKPKVVEIDPG